MSVRLFDAHNHLQDERLAPHLADILSMLDREGVVRIAVNGSCETDWPQVLELAQRDKRILPCFGYHPWYVRERSPPWRDNLQRFLDACPAAIGEIGLDRWIQDYDLPAQEEAFVCQLRLAAERNLPVSIHCLQAWGRLLELLQANPPPACGFLLHSFGGPKEMVPKLAELGAYFSLPGYFAEERKSRQREAFKSVPLDRFLIETDAPDQLLPESLEAYSLRDSQSGKRLNHPANIGAVYRFAANLLERSLPELAQIVETNFQRLFRLRSAEPV